MTVTAERKGEHVATPTALIAERVREILDNLGVDYEDDNFRETPERFTKYLLGHFVVDEKAVLDDVMRATFPSEYNGMVVESNIDVDGMCPHHLLPVSYRIAVAYLPGERVVGLSKLARVARVFGRQAILQEDVTKKIAHAIETILEARGVAVIVQGKHSCMTIRGVRAGATATTSSILGTFREKPAAKEEFYTLLGMSGWHTTA